MVASIIEAFDRCSKLVTVVNMGETERLSRIMGTVTFVTHPLLPCTSAPGQISVAQLHKAKHTIGLLSARSFYIFGDKIGHSLSPVIHNAAFTELSLPHNYSPFSTQQINDQVRQILTQSNFGGASVTAPHKLQIQPLLDSLTDAVMKIGAVNTVTVDESRGRRLLGHNTDWLGILALISQRLTHPTGDAMVIGAGGAARAAVFALQTSWSDAFRQKV